MMGERNLHGLEGRAAAQEMDVVWSRHFSDTV